jgi:hypothetical protein
LIRLLFANVFPQFHYRRGGATQISHYLTRGGASVPLVFISQLGVAGYIPIVTGHPTRSALSSAASFVKHHRDAVAVIAHQGDDVREWGERIYSIPMRWLL